MGYSEDISLLIKEHIDTSRLYTANEHIFEEGDPFRGVYYIVGGSVRILKNNHNQPIMLWVGEVNEFIGITSYFDNSDNYQFTATASELNCKLIYFPAAKFSELINKIPGIKEEIMKEFCKRINFIELRINNHSQHGARRRFIDTINFIFKHLNSTEQNQNLKGPVLRYSLNDLTEMVGTSKKTLSNLIKEFENNNLLQVQGDNIIILDINQFRKIAEV